MKLTPDSSWFIVALLSIIMAIIGISYGLTHLKPGKSPEYDEDLIVVKHQEGRITYLIFGNGNGLQVKNYTSDSMEYEFLHSPTKTDNEQIYGRDTIYLSGGDIRKSLKVR